MALTYEVVDRAYKVGICARKIEALVEEWKGFWFIDGANRQTHQGKGEACYPRGLSDAGAAKIRIDQRGHS